MADVKARIAAFSQAVLTPEEWFRRADELIAAMDLLEPDVKHHWEYYRTLVLDEKTEMVPPKRVLVNVHMMLAGFAIENLCKGYLAGQLSPKERTDAKAGALPDSLMSHNLLELIEKTGMTLSDTEEYLVKRLTETVFWRGRYPSPILHKWLGPFAQIGSDIDRIKRVLSKLRRHVGAKDS
jgi:hypothetical protein